MNAFARALALFDALAEERVSLEAVGNALDLVGEPSAPLQARLAAFCGEHDAREGLDTYRALRAVVRAPSRAARELLGLVVAYAVGLPHPFTITFRRSKQTCVCTTSRQMFAQAVAEGLPTFLLRELEAAARAVELGRASPADMDRWLELKARSDWRLTPEFAGVVDVPGSDGGESALVSFGELFDALGAELVAVELHEVAPEQGKVGAA